jgi:hypothetical protein
MLWRPRGGQIVLSLQGGIGNQLFEWAFGHELERAGFEVVFDGVRCRGDRPLMVRPLIRPDRMLSVGAGLALVLGVKAGLISEHSKLRLVRQRRSGFDPSVGERVAGGCYLLGYFQSPRYFASSADSVRSSVRGLLESMLTPVGVELARRLRADGSSVAVHVRRGDYMSNPEAAVRHGVLGREYYDQALTLLRNKGPRNVIWFGDDPDWVRANLAQEGDLVCPPEATTAAGGEIALMASCRSRVIANSSFSWWGGWLGDESTTDHPVIAPLSWFADGHSDAGELVPDSWVRL